MSKLKDSIRGFLPKRLPSWSQSQFFVKVLNREERALFYALTLIFFVSLIGFSYSLYINNTEVAPAYGGTYTEGMVGHPNFVNPIYSAANDVDRDVVGLLFSGLIDYNFNDGFEFNLAEDITEEGDSYTLKLKDGLKWSDGESITAEDVAFTVKVIQDPDYRSPLRPDWIGVRVEEVSDLEISFELDQASPMFINKLSLKVIPKHIWQDVTPQNFLLSSYSIDSVVSGPYQIAGKVISGDNMQALNLKPNPNYHGKTPYISNFNISFFSSKEELVSAAKKGQIDGFAVINPKNYQQITSDTRFKGYRFEFPRYFALFFNNQVVDDINIRKALTLAIDKNKLIEDVLSGRGRVVNSPIIPEIYNFDFGVEADFNLTEAEEILESSGFILNENGFRSKVVREEKELSFDKDLKVGSQGEAVRDLQRCLIYLSETDQDLFPNGTVSGFYGQETRDAVNNFQEKYHEEILAPGGFSSGTGMVAKGTRAKLSELCQEIPSEAEDFVFTITTVDQPLMIQMAESIKSQWELVGVKSEIITYNQSSLEREIIKPREYEMILFGNAYEAIPDPFPFWHSSQVTEFGLNLSLYQNKDTDTLLEMLRVETESEQKIVVLEKIQETILEKYPAIFLCSVDYLHFASDKILGINPASILNPSHRFLEVEDWYTKTKRIIK
ncbi:MAG: ABC transporter substrate-binding protein [Candidatus Pacebacteria bacterium]|nr:ABC transporter substrate-binding protein [Candidatus Paceibacterota bacterium]